MLSMAGVAAKAVSLGGAALKDRDFQVADDVTLHAPCSSLNPKP